MTTVTVKFEKDRFQILDKKVKRLGYNDIQRFLDAIIDDEISEQEISEYFSRFEAKLARGEKTPGYYADNIADVTRLINETTDGAATPMTQQDWADLKKDLRNQYQAHKSQKQGA